MQVKRPKADFSQKIAILIGQFLRQIALPERLSSFSRAKQLIKTMETPS
jgi:hypothetical protein